MQNGRAGRLHPAVGTARRHLAAALEKLLGAGSIKATGRSRTASTADAADLPLLLVACSGGPDSLALAAIAAHFARRGDVRVGAIIVDHDLQEDSAAVAAQTAQTLTDLGLHPVITEKVQVPVGNMGPEMAARTARYTAFTKAVEATGARAVLLGHTLDDQAETVLLGLSRGSGTRSLAGMPPVRVEEGVTYLRPFLSLRRTDMLDICDAETLTPWIDPTNADQSLMRARIRHSVLPYLEEHLGGDVARSLARTASVAGPDAEYLDEQAQAAYEQALLPAGTAVRGTARSNAGHGWLVEWAHNVFIGCEAEGSSWAGTVSGAAGADEAANWYISRNARGTRMVAPVSYNPPEKPASLYGFYIENKIYDLRITEGTAKDDRIGEGNMLGRRVYVTGAIGANVVIEVEELRHSTSPAGQLTKEAYNVMRG